MSERRPTILHVDLDAFFVSMELLRHPELRGLPVVVGGDGKRGVVTTASYEARRFGVRSAMPTARARQLCPQAVFLPTDFAYYAPASKAFHAILADFSPRVEPAGADEAFLDVAGCEALFGDALAIGQAIRGRVRAEVGITASVGIATNRLVAKVASDACKPDGILEVEPGGEAPFLAPRPIRELPMVGPRTTAVLESMGIHTIGELAAVPVGLLTGRFGPHGAELHERAVGRGGATVGEGRGRARSVSRETTFGTDVTDGARLRAILRGQCERVAADLAQRGRSARSVALKLRFPPFETITRSATPARPVGLAESIYAEAERLFTIAWTANSQRPVRLIGVGVSGLQERAEQIGLGENLEAVRLAEAVGELRGRFGPGVIRRAAEIERTEAARPEV